MATTGARRPASPGTVRQAKGGPAPVQVGVLWGYPFSLVRRLFLVFLCLLGLTFAAAHVLASHPLDPVDVLIHVIPVALAILVAMYVAELVGVTERPRPPLSVEALFWAIATACIVLGIGYAVVPTYAPSTALVCASPVLAALAVFLHRKWEEIEGLETEAVPAILFAGDREDAARSMAELADAPGVRVKAILLPPDARDRSPMVGLPVHLPDEALDHLADRDVRLFVVGRVPAEALRPILPACAGAGCIIETVQELVAKSQGRVGLTEGSDITLLNRISTNANRFAAQRFLDIVLVHLMAPVALLLAIPVALLIKLTSRGPVLYRQERIGRWGRPFTIYKFRTMRADAERETGPVWAKENDPRLTPVGGWLRRTRLDELPQLWNVLRGDMSLVGPRPERPYFVADLRGKIPLYDARHSVRPGVTGWAQIRYDYGATEEDARTKLGYELFYILNRSLTFYFTVLLETGKVILFRRGAR